MQMQRAACPHCGSGDVEALLPSRHRGDVLSGVPSASRRCMVCGIRWELDDIGLDLGDLLA